MWQLRGHDTLVGQLDRTFCDGRAPHAYLIVGPPHVGKGTLAVDIAQRVNCTTAEGAPCGSCNQCQRVDAGSHADIQVISTAREEDGVARRQIGISAVRELQHQASLKPYEGACRVYIFDGAEDMSTEAANALLKVLEEPPDQVLFLLLSAQEEALLPTIRSRCHRIELHPLPISVVAQELVSSEEMGPEQANVLARLSRGCLGWALSAAREPAVMEQRATQVERIARLSFTNLEARFDYGGELATRYARDRQDVIAELEQWLRWWRDILLMKEGGEEHVRNVDQMEPLRQVAGQVTTQQVVKTITGVRDTIEALESNANPRLVLETLMLALPARQKTPWKER